MSLALALVLALSAFVAVMGVVGARTNRRLAAQISTILEQAFHPEVKRYTNIGGVVGYHFEYDTGALLGRVEGTMTFLPRHTVLYLPFSLLAGRQDRLSIVLHPENSPPGSGHIFDAHQHRGGWFPVEDEEEMERLPFNHGGRDFVILSYNPLVRDRLADALRRIPDVSCLRHFGYVGSSYTYVVELQPRTATLASTLEFLIAFVVDFSKKPL